MIGLPSIFGLKGMAIAAGVAYAAGLGSGVWITQKIYGYREARAVIKALRTDLDASKQLQEAADKRAKDLADRDAQNQGTINALQLEISQRVPADQCLLTDDRARWLRELGRAGRSPAPRSPGLRSTR